MNIEVDDVAFTTLGDKPVDLPSGELLCLDELPRVRNDGPSRLTLFSESVPRPRVVQVEWLGERLNVSVSVPAFSFDGEAFLAAMVIGESGEVAAYDLIGAVGSDGWFGEASLDLSRVSGKGAVNLFVEVREDGSSDAASRMTEVRR
jgi:hypothetical protein